MRRAIPTAALALALTIGLAVAQSPDPRLARAFEVRYRSLTDAADVVGAVLSADGAITLKPQLRMLVVEDRRSVLERVESLLRSFDLPPRGVEVTVSLFLGTKRAAEEEEALRAAPRRGIIDVPILNFTNWTRYESLGSRSLNGIEGGEVTADLSDDYRITLLVEDVDERLGKVRFKSVSLQRVARSEEGLEQIRNVLSATVVVDAGKQFVLGAAKNPEADSALFLTLKAQVR